MRQRFFASIFLFAILVQFGCDSRQPPALITPSVRLNKATVETGTPVEVTYTFQTSQDFDGFKKDLIVFVHFIDPKGTIRFVDDHTPPILTNQWGPDQEYSYTRTVFIPDSIPVGEYVVELGMYTPSGKGERFALNAKRLSERSYEVGNFKIRELTPEAKGQYVQGWYDLEREPGNPWEHWRWTAATAELHVPNPGADAILYLKADSDRARFPEPQNITIRLGDDHVDSFPLDTGEPILKKYSLSSKELGSDKTLRLRLEVDRTFRPSTEPSGDTRDLGVRVYCFYLGKAKE